MARLTSQPAALISAAVAIARAAGLMHPESRKGRLKVPPHGIEERMAEMSDADLAAIIEGERTAATA